MHGETVKNEKVPLINHFCQRQANRLWTQIKGNCGQLQVNRNFHKNYIKTHHIRFGLDINNDLTKGRNSFVNLHAIISTNNCLKVKVLLHGKH